LVGGFPNEASEVAGTGSNCKAEILEGYLRCCLIVSPYNKDAFGGLWEITSPRPYFLELLIFFYLHHVVRD
jgi:hypothetical protein